MTSEIIERLELDWHTGSELSPAERVEYDGTYLQVAKTVWVASQLIEAIEHPDSAPPEANQLVGALRQELARNEDLPNDVDQDYGDELVAAFKAGNRMLNRDDREQLEQNFSTIDNDTIQELRATVGYVAPHFGIEIDFPDTGREEVTRSNG